ncbi:MAG: hypothetical protein GY748_23700 [Planctomycetaceae bacterium]|nr:hypothetical protein [Planctomycetaceae bacterium]
MLYVDFSGLVDSYITTQQTEFRIKVAEQISFLKIKPKQYDDLFDFSNFKTAIDWNINLTNLIKMLRKGKGDINKAVAFYFLFHQREAFRPAARNLDFFLFGNGVTFEDKFDCSEFGHLPSFQNHASTRTDRKSNSQQSPDDTTKKTESPSGLILKINDLINNDPKISKFFYRLDYENTPDSFRFDAEKFPLSEDERSLDRLLFHLSIIGGVLRRGEVEVRDLLWMRYIVARTIENAEVHKYFAWIQTDDQIPGHCDFCDAIYLYEQLIGRQPSSFSKLERYQKNALAYLQNMTE